jgi:hypothetical protein
MKTYKTPKEKHKPTDVRLQENRIYVFISISKEQQIKITVNNIPLDLHDGAKVKDAILKYYAQQGINKPKKFPLVEDRYGNSVASDGELTDGNTLFIKTKHKKRSSFPKFVFTAFAIGLLFACSTGKKAITREPGDKRAIIFAVNDMHAAIDNFPKLA